MGTLTSYDIAGLPVCSTKSNVDPVVMTIFRESDKLINGQPAKINEISANDEDEHSVMCVLNVSKAIDRLNIMGFTLEASKAWFGIGIKEELNKYLEWDKEGDESWLEPQIKRLKGITFNLYLEAFYEILTKGIPYWTEADELPDGSNEVMKYIFSHDLDNGTFGFPVHDVRFFIRAALEVAPIDGAVIQDVTEVIRSGYYNKHDRVCDDAIESLTNRYFINSKIIILTEGSSDKNTLEPALELLYPHLSEFYSFMDFGVSNVKGGALSLYQP